MQTYASRLLAYLLRDASVDLRFDNDMNVLLSVCCRAVQLLPDDLECMRQLVWHMVNDDVLR